MLISAILKDVKNYGIIGNTNVEIDNVICDSREIKENSMFICISGFAVDGHDFVQEVIEKGAKCIVVEKDIDVVYPSHVTVIKVENTRIAMAQISNNFFESPTKYFNLIGVTGTKGKTTTTYMIKSILESARQKTGLVGTIANFVGGKKFEAHRTTPEAIELQKLFSDMKNENIDSAIMEVSSQGLALSRVDGCNFDIGVFTNLSKDHIGGNEHKNMQEYFEAKLKLFNICKIGLVNIDSEYGREVAQNSLCRIYTYGINVNADIYAKNIITHSDSVEFDIFTPWGEDKIKANTPGKFSVYNALASIGVSLLMGISFEDIKIGLMNVNVPGRAEIVNINKDYTMMIDYAHTPDSIENILKSVKEFAKGRVVTLFGCGGDRDKTKRPIMGKIAGSISDFCIVTSDNPRTEDPMNIIRQVEVGVQETDCEYVVIESRRDAIEYAINNAKKDDIIILVGKGHENYQILKDKTIHFDEKEIIYEIINSKQ